jgi:hypothetical protein
VPAKSLSYTHALNSIRVMYMQAKFTVTDHTLGQQVYREFGSEVAETKLGALYAFVDEQLALLRMVAWYFMSGIPQAESAERAAVFYRLTIAQMRTLASIRMLCSCGFDINARHELRKLYENSLLWVRLRLDPSALAAFAKAATPESANHFWHMYLAKGKSEKYIEGALANGQIWFGHGTKLFDELKSKVGPASHPSSLAAAFDAQQDFAEEGDLLVLGAPHGGSHFTLSHAIVCAAMPFSIKPEPLYGLQTQNFLKIGHPFNCIPFATESWEEYGSHIRDMIPSLFLMAVRFSDKLAMEDLGDSSV